MHQVLIDDEAVLHRLVRAAVVHGLHAGAQAHALAHLVGRVEAVVALVHVHQRVHAGHIVAGVALALLEAGAHVQLEAALRTPGHLTEGLVAAAGRVGLVPQPGEAPLVEVGIEGPLPRGPHLDAGVQPALVGGPAALAEPHAVDVLEVALVVAVQQAQAHAPVQRHQHAGEPGHAAVRRAGHLAEPGRVAPQHVPVHPHVGHVLPVELELVVGLQVAVQLGVEGATHGRGAHAPAAPLVAQVTAEAPVADGVLLLQLAVGAVEAVLLEAGERLVLHPALQGVHPAHVGVQRTVAVEGGELEVPAQVDGGAAAAQEQVLVHAGVGAQPRGVPLDVHGERALGGEGQPAPVGEPLPELRLEVAHGHGLHPAHVPQEQVRAVEVEAVRLGAGEELLALVLLRRDPEADVLPVAEAVARVQLVARAQVQPVVPPQAVQHGGVVVVGQRVAVGVVVVAAEAAVLPREAAPLLQPVDAAHPELVVAVLQDLLQAGAAASGILAHGDERPDQRDGGRVEAVDGLQLVEAQHATGPVHVRQQGADLHVVQQVQFGELLGAGAVQVQRVAIAVHQHLEQVGQVHVGVVAQPLGGDLDPLLDQVAGNGLVHLGMRRARRHQQHGQERLPHGKR